MLLQGIQDGNQWQEGVQRYIFVALQCIQQIYPSSIQSLALTHLLINQFTQHAADSQGVVDFQHFWFERRWNSEQGRVQALQVMQGVVESTETWTTLSSVRFWGWGWNKLSMTSPICNLVTSVVAWMCPRFCFHWSSPWIWMGPVGKAICFPSKFSRTAPHLCWSLRPAEPWHPSHELIYRPILVGGLEHFLFSHILGIIIPID